MAARMLKTDGDGEIEQAFSLFDDGSGCVNPVLSLAPARRLLRL